MLIALVITGLNFFIVQSLLKKTTAYEKVGIENQLVPETDENGNRAFADRMETLGAYRM